MAGFQVSHGISSVWSWYQWLSASKCRRVRGRSPVVYQGPGRSGCPSGARSRIRRPNDLSSWYRRRNLRRYHTPRSDRRRRCPARTWPHHDLPALAGWRREREWIPLLRACAPPATAASAAWIWSPRPYGFQRTRLRRLGCPEAPRVNLGVPGRCSRRRARSPVPNRLRPLPN